VKSPFKYITHIFALIAIGIISYFSEKIQCYFKKTRKEKIVKNSEKIKVLKHLVPVFYS